jgi:hypothetical protein
MDKGQLFIANLSKGKIGHEKANLLGSLLVTQFQHAAMMRADQPEAERRDFFLFVDEFQNFATDAFAAVLAEARKYRLCLTLSHQYIDQLPLPIRQAVFGNVGTMASFHVGHSDAEVLAKQFGNTFLPQQFVDLDRFAVFVKLLENGSDQTPFRGMTLHPLATHSGRRQKLIDRSRRRFAARRSVVEARLHRWIKAPPLTSSDRIPRRRRNRHSEKTSFSPKSPSEWAGRKTKQHPGTPIPV